VYFLGTILKQELVYFTFAIISFHNKDNFIKSRPKSAVIAVTVILASTRWRISAQYTIRPNGFPDDIEPHGLYGVTVR
jgi:hypothetical protein